jgi:DNA-directed RNA polymerase specialized sigma24 family protein
MPKICLEQKGLNHLARKDVHTFKQKCTLPIEIKTSTNYISIEESQIEEKTSESPVLDSLNKYDKNDGLILGMDSTKEKSYSVDDIRKDYPNAYMPWEENEELELIKLYMSGTSIKEISSIIGRKESGIRSRLRKLNLH